MIGLSKKFAYSAAGVAAMSVPANAASGDTDAATVERPVVLVSPSSAANRIETIADLKRVEAELDRVKMASFQNYRTLSARIDAVSAAVLSVQRQGSDNEDSASRAELLNINFLMLLEGGEAADSTVLDAADIEHFPIGVIEIARQNLQSDDVGVRIGSVRVLVLGGSDADTAIAKSALKKEESPFARKMMGSAFEAVLA
jgi:hypothetical protein